MTRLDRFLYAIACLTVPVALAAAVGFLAVGDPIAAAVLVVMSAIASVGGWSVRREAEDVETERVLLGFEAASSEEESHGGRLTPTGVVLHPAPVEPETPQQAADSFTARDKALLIAAAIDGLSAHVASCLPCQSKRAQR